MMNTALLTGPYDWDAELLPLPEFQERLAQVRRVLAEQQVAALVVHGNSLEYGALAWLTGFVPKLGPAFALISREDPIRLLIAGSPSMLPAAKRLTWIDDVNAVGDLKLSLADWFSQLPDAAGLSVGLWGDPLMTLRANLAVRAAIQRFGRIVELHDRLQAVRLAKSPRERELLRRACAMLTISHDAFLDAVRQGCGARSAALAAERSAFQAGAQDVRILASAKDGGAPVAFDGAFDPIRNPLIACIAVRFAGYWSEGFLTCGSNRGSLVRAQAALSAMLSHARADQTFSALRATGEREISPYRANRFIRVDELDSIGLGLDDVSGGGSGAGQDLKAGGVYTLCAGAAGEGSDSAIVSAVIAVDARNTEILWPSVAGPSNAVSVRESP
jgi:hypothetical protein